ncbi:MAG TPA: polysaccharide deacetylase family protein [Micromonosporaceae bacterium]
MTRRSVAALAAALTVTAVIMAVQWAVSREAAVRPAEWHARPVVVDGPSLRPAGEGAPSAGGTTPRAPKSPTTPTPTSRATRPAQSPSPSASQRPSRSPTAQALDLQRTTGAEGVALTFDDGPHPVWTPKILEELRESRVHATFCLVGTQAKKYPDLVARIVREGHTLCNHSWNHEFDLGERSAAEIRANLQRTNDAIRRAVPDAEISYFRHPGGKWTPAAVQVAQELGMRALHWSVDPRDWERPSAEVLVQRVTEKAKPGAIVLLHDGGGDRTTTVAACPEIIRDLKRRYGIILLG